MDNPDFRVTGYRGSALLVETVHRGVSSMEMTVSAWRDRMARGECDRITIADLRPAWVRAQHGNGPWSRDLTQTIESARSAERR